MFGKMVSRRGFHEPAMKLAGGVLGILCVALALSAGVHADGPAASPAAGPQEAPTGFIPCRTGSRPRPPSRRTARRSRRSRRSSRTGWARSITRRAARAATRTRSRAAPARSPSSASATTGRPQRPPEAHLHRAAQRVADPSAGHRRGGPGARPARIRGPDPEDVDQRPGRRLRRGHPGRGPPEDPRRPAEGMKGLPVAVPVPVGPRAARRRASSRRSSGSAASAGSARRRR